MIHFDMTFCTGARCDKASTCERWTENLKIEAKKRNWDLGERRISMAQFTNRDGDCKMYQPFENKDSRDRGDT